MNYSYSSPSVNNSSPVVSSATSGYPVRFWAYLFSDIFSLICGLFDIYYLLSVVALRRALHNHIIIVLLFIGVFYELTNIIWILYNDHNGSPLIRSEIFYMFWTYINYSFYSLQVELFAWATIERHILIFHTSWISTKRRRFLIHYLPIIGIGIYYLIYFAFVHFYQFCQSNFDAFLAGGIHIPCVFHRTTLGMWDLMVHQVIPTLTIAVFSTALIIRTIIQKNKLSHEIQWKKYRKMIIQLLTISTIYIAFNGPWVLVIFSFQYGLSESIAIVALVYTGFLYYYVIFTFPFVCCLSLPELRKKAINIILCGQMKKNNQTTSDVKSTTKVTTTIPAK